MKNIMRSLRRQQKRSHAQRKKGAPLLPWALPQRALESAAQKTGITEPGTNTTRLFIREGYQWKVVDGLITNFHVPRSSLLMLVAALIGREKLFELYAYAQANGFTFLSFGDGMLLLPK